MQLEKDKHELEKHKSELDHQQKMKEMAEEKRAKINDLKIKEFELNEVESEIVEEFDETVFMKVTKNTYNYVLFTGEFISGVLLLFVILSLILMKMLFNARKRVYLFTLNQYNPLPEDAK